MMNSFPPAQDLNRSRPNNYGNGTPNNEPQSSESTTTTTTMPPKLPDLDPSFLEGCASLLDQVDKRVIVLLRDEKTLIGILRSLDQFNNLVLQNTVERISIGDKFGDIPRGLYIVRGDTVVLVGEMDGVLERSNTKMTQVPIDVILSLQREEQEANKRIELRREQAFKDRGMVYVKDAGLDDV